jgi:Sec-independent protein secretion pathway component TatC
MIALAVPMLILYIFSIGVGAAVLAFRRRSKRKAEKNQQAADEDDSVLAD